MNERPTPETDAAIINFEYDEVWLGGELGGGSKEIIEPDFARKMELQRDEVRAVTAAQHALMQEQIAELGELRLKVAELRDDAERLSWLEKEIGPGHAGAVVRIANLMSESPFSLRAAIDAAMKS